MNGNTTSSEPLCCVFGATGSQGGSVATELLRDGRWSVRAVTRRPRAQPAAWLDTAGAEVMQADMNDLLSVQKALKGACAVFANIPSGNPAIRERERDLGTAVANAAKEAGVTHFIWAGLPNAKQLSKGKHDVTHFTDKAFIWEHIKSLGFQFVTSIEASFYYSNLTRLEQSGGICGIAKDSDGGLVLQLADMKDTSINTGFDVTEMGPVVAKVLAHPEIYNDKRIRFKSACHQPMSQWASDLAEVTGRPAAFRTAPEGLAPPAVREMMQYFDECGGSYADEEGPDIIDASEVLGRPLKSFKQWLREAHWIKKL